MSAKVKTTLRVDPQVMDRIDKIAKRITPKGENPNRSAAIEMILQRGLEALAKDPEALARMAPAIETKKPKGRG